MKGVFFQQQVEYGLEVAGEEWRQGDPLSCVLRVKNHGSAAKSLSGVSLSLAVGNLKKIKQKAEDAFTTIAAADLSISSEIEPQQDLSFDWTFKIDNNFSIADKASSPYILFGPADGEESNGQLPVALQPHPHIQVLHRILETTFRFVLKQQRSAKGWVEAKFKPSSAPRFSTLEHLMLYSRFDGDDLVLRYVFHVKRLAATASSVGLQKSKVETKQQLDSARYLFPGGIVNHDPLEAAIEEAIAAAQLGL